MERHSANSPCFPTPETVTTRCQNISHPTKAVGDVILELQLELHLILHHIQPRNCHSPPTSLFQHRTRRKLECSVLCSFSTPLLAIACLLIHLLTLRLGVDCLLARCRQSIARAHPTRGCVQSRAF